MLALAKTIRGAVVEVDVDVPAVPQLVNGPPRIVGCVQVHLGLWTACAIRHLESQGTFRAFPRADCKHSHSYPKCTSHALRDRVSCGTATAHRPARL